MVTEKKTPQAKETVAPAYGRPQEDPHEHPSACTHSPSHTPLAQRLEGSACPDGVMQGMR